MAVNRFHREARAAGAIDTQHITQVLDVGTDPTSGLPYFCLAVSPVLTFAAYHALFASFVAPSAAAGHQDA